MLDITRIGCLVALVAGLSGPQDGADVADLLARVREESDRVDPAVFEQLGQGADEESFEALKRCVELVASQAALDAAFGAFRHLQGTEQEHRALAFLVSRSAAKEASVRRAAVGGLVRFGDPARAALEKITRSSPHPALRHIAVGGLVPALREEGTRDALEVLLDNFRVPESGPERLAVGTLRAFDDEQALEAFGSRLRDGSYPEHMKLVILDAFVTMHAPGIDELLVRMLRGRDVPPSTPDIGGSFAFPDAAVLVAALEALTARGHSEHLALLQKLERSPDPSVRRAALVAQGPLQTDRDAWVRELFERSRAADAALRAGAAMALGEVDTPAARQALYAILRDRDESVRFEAYCAVGDQRRKESIALLIESLEEEESYLRWSPHFELRMITGEDHGVSRDRWRSWWEDVRASFVVPPWEEALRRERERRDRSFQRQTRAWFYDLVLTGEPACLVVDTSISMSEGTASGVSRQVAAQRQLIQVLGRVPLGQQVNLVFFAYGVHPFRRRMVVLDEQLRQEALRFVWNQPLLGGTSISDALEFALEDAGVATIYLLTDGEPTTGRITSEAGILREIRRHRELREFTIHCVDVGGAGRRLLEGLAESTGGDLVETK